MARQNGWRIILRIDDLAGPRIKRDAAKSAIFDLQWLGIEWESEPVYQSARLAHYRAAMRALAQSGQAFPCQLTRTEIEAAQAAPHAPAPGEHGESRFPPELRPPIIHRDFTSEDERSSWRFVTPDEPISFVDGFAGEQSHNPHQTVGDFVIWTKDGEPAYQLATVVDDHLLGVTHVVRGDDLLDSAARQLALFRALGYTPEPAFVHLPLVVGPDGRRLAKRHGDTRISFYRELGVPAGRIMALLARWSGISDSPEEMSADAFAEAFNPDTMARTPTTFTPEDDQWLRASS